MAAEKTARKASAPKAASASERIQVRTPNTPGYSNTVDKAKYDAMLAMLKTIIPKGGDGITQNEMLAAAQKLAPKTTFPGTTPSWWAKCVQLDQEARGNLARRADAKPLRWA